VASAAARISRCARQSEFAQIAKPWDRLEALSYIDLPARQRFFPRAKTWHPIIAMIRHRFSSFHTRTFILTASALAAGTLAWALHPKSAGPESFEIKFKLPPPTPLSAAEELKTFKVAKGFHVELVASEPMVETPVAQSWDEKGRLFVCEMRGYMHDVEGKAEDQPVGRISVLEDTDGDGKMDKSTVFADKLILARAVLCVNGGALVSEPPVLWFMKDTNGDGVADVKEQVDGAYATRGGQPEHMANSPARFLDNWIYSANHGMRYKLKDGKWIAEGTASRGQWGMTQDDYGRPFYNFNSDFLRANFVPETLYKRNPNFPASAGTGMQIMKDQTTWPSHQTPGVNRGYEPKQLRDDGTLAKCTATCGAGVYRGGLFPKEFAGNVFIPEPAGNLVKRVIISEKDAVLTAKNAFEGSEFLTSTDERFRPVNAYTGPDGALYITDMYRGVIQHKSFLTHYLIANIKDRKLEEPVNMGRIWRIVPDGAKPQLVKLPEESAKIVDFLGDKNGVIRDTAQRLLVEKKDGAVAPAIAKIATSSANALAKIHALWTLEGMAALTPDVITACLKDKNAKVRATAVRVADRTLATELAKLVNDPSVDVQIALAFSLSAFPETQEATLALGRRTGTNPLVREAIVSGLRGRELDVLTALITATDKPAPAEVLGALSQAVMNERRSAHVKTLLTLIAAQTANSPNQIAMLEGAAGKNAPKNAPKVKILYLDSEAAELAALAKNANGKTKPLVAAVDARVAWPNKPGVPPPPVIVPLTADQQKLFETGRTVYSTLCTACHQPTGTGMEGLAPALVDSDWVLGNPDIIARIIIHGLAGPIKVNGQSWSLEMPPLGAALSDEQVAGVITYIRREWEHNGSPITTAAVAKIREQNKARTKTWTEAELKPAAPKKPASDKTKPETKAAAK
jgi:mono/diheme cytochrome c family protein/glucose/arabinose dehydrogenase